MSHDDRFFWWVMMAVGLMPWLGVAAIRLADGRIFPPMRNRAVPWNLVDVFILFAFFLFLLPMLYGSVYSALQVSLSGRDLFKLSAGLGFCTFLSVPLVLVKWRGARPYQIGLHGDRLVRNIVLGVAAYLLAMPLVGAVLLIAAEFFGPPQHEIEELVRSTPTAHNITLAWVAAVVAAPLQEELLFRGVLLPALRRVFGMWPAILGSSALFAGMHFTSWPAPIPLFVLAVALGFLACRTGSLVAPITLHATFNGVMMAVLVSSLGRDKHQPVEASPAPSEPNAARRVLPVIDARPATGWGLGDSTPATRVIDWLDARPYARIPKEHGCGLQVSDRPARHHRHPLESPVQRPAGFRARVASERRRCDPREDTG
jgi:membrane protease YdiL (CAAX protease family)